MNIGKKYLKILDAINHGLEILIGIVLFVLIVSVFGQVLARFVHISVPVLDEAARYLNLYMGFIAAAIAVRTNSMIKIDTLHIALKGKAREIVIEISRAISLIFIAFMIYSGFLLFKIGIGQRTATLGFEMSAVYIIIPITFAFSILNWIGHSFERWVLKKK